MPDTDLIYTFCNYILTQKRYSENTVKSYYNDLVGMREYLRTEYEIEDLTKVSGRILRSWLSSLKEQQMEATTVNRKLSAVKSFYKYLLRQQMVNKSPADTISSLKIRKNLPVFVEEKQLEPVLERSFFPLGFEGDTHHLIFVIFYLTGMRVSELASLKESDVRFSASMIIVHGKGNKQRNIPVGNDLLGIIKNYLQEKKRLFAKPAETLIVNSKNISLSRMMIYKIVNQTLQEVTTIQKKSPHVLRHSFATHLSNHGASIGAIKELLGHSSLAATQVYTHTSIARLKEIYDKAHPKS